MHTHTYIHRRARTRRAQCAKDECTHVRTHARRRVAAAGSDGDHGRQEGAREGGQGRAKRSGTHDTHALMSQRHEPRAHVVGASAACPRRLRQRQPHDDDPPSARSRRSPPPRPRANHTSAQCDFTAFSRWGSPPCDYDDDYDVDYDVMCVAVIVACRWLDTLRRTRRVRGRDRESGLSAHLPQRGPTAAGTGEFTIFGPKIVAASTKAVFQQWWPSTQRARPSCAGPTPSGGGATHVSVSRASRRATTQCDATRRDTTRPRSVDRTIIPCPRIFFGGENVYLLKEQFARKNNILSS